MVSALLYLPNPVLLLCPHCQCWNSDHRLSSKPAEPTPPPLPTLTPDWSFQNLDMIKLQAKSPMGLSIALAHWPASLILLSAHLPTCIGPLSLPQNLVYAFLPQSAPCPSFRFHLVSSQSAARSVSSLPVPVQHGYSHVSTWLVVCINLVSYSKLQ